MEKIQAVLVDDEPANTKTLELLLKQYCPSIETVKTFSNPALALKEIPKLKPQLLFLDIEMPHLSGFDLLAKLKTYSGGVIFVTAHSNYAVRAFKFSAVDYLLKPVEPKELKQAVQKFIKHRQIKPGHNEIKQLSGNIDYLAQPIPRKIAVATTASIEVVTLEDVEYFKADRNYTLIKRSGKKDIMVSKTLKDFEETLSAGSFMRVHLSYIVNINKVDRYVRAEGGYAVMNDGSQITISRSHRQEFLHRLNS